MNKKPWKELCQKSETPEPNKSKEEKNIDDETVDASFKKIAFSSLFLFGVFAFLFELVRFNYFLSSYNGWLVDLSSRITENKTDQAEAINKYTDYLGSIQAMVEK